MEATVQIKKERISASLPTMLPDPAALMCRKLMSCSSLTLSTLVEGSDAERAENIQLYTLQLSNCHQSECFDLEADSRTFSTLLSTASTPLQVKVCELLTTYIKAAKIDDGIIDNEEGIRSAGDLLNFYRKIHEDMVKYALPNVRAGDHCAMFLCNLISICSSRKVFLNVVNMFGENITSLLPKSHESGAYVELSADNARQVIGIMKTLLHLTKAFGTPPAPFRELCDIASMVICTTKAHLCRLYSYNILAFLLRKVTKEDDVTPALPKLSPPQVRQVITLLKEASHLKDANEWSFHYRPSSPVEQFATPMKPNFFMSSTTLGTRRVSSATKDGTQVDKNVFTPPAIGPLDAVNKDTATSTVSKERDAEVETARISEDHREILENRASRGANAVTRKMSTGSSASCSSSSNSFKPDWVRTLLMHFVESRHGAKAAEYDREAWKSKNEALSAIVSNVQNIEGKVILGHSTSQLITILENILKHESAMPLLLNGLKLAALLIDKSSENFTRNTKAQAVIELIYERLKDSNNKVQNMAMICVAWIITRSEGSINVDCIKKALSQKSPLARIAMCSLISGSVALPEGIANIAMELQGVKTHLLSVIQTLLTDKDAKVRAAACLSDLALKDPSTVKAKVIPSQNSVSLAKTTKGAGVKTVSAPGKKVMQRATESDNNLQAVKEANETSTTNEKCESNTVEAIPTKRKLVRRFLKRSLPKHRNKSNDVVENTVVSGSVPPSTSTSDTRVDKQIPTNGNGDVTSTIIATMQPVAAGNIEETNIREYASNDSQMSSSKLEESCDLREDQGIGMPHASSTHQSVEQEEIKISHGCKIRQSVRESETQYSYQNEISYPSTHELMLQSYIPEPILGKVAKRGQYRRSLPEGLYELSKWINSNSDVASACEMHLLQFVSGCTNKFKEPYKTAKTAVYTFLEDIVQHGLSEEGATFLITSLVSDLLNPRVSSILKQIKQHCTADTFIHALLLCEDAGKHNETAEAVLQLIEDVISASGAGNMSTMALAAISSYCMKLLNAGERVSLLAKKLMADCGLQANSTSAEVPYEPPEQNTSKEDAVAGPPDVETDNYTSKQEEEPLPATEGKYQLPTVPERMLKGMQDASDRLEKSVSKDLYDCMFSVNDNDNDKLKLACAFWDMYILQSKERADNMIFGEDNVRSQLLLWLCHTLLRGLANESVVSSIANIFSRMNELHVMLSEEDTAMVMETLVLFSGCDNGQTGLRLLEHMLQVTDSVTKDLLIDLCPPNPLWKEKLKSLVSKRDETVQVMEMEAKGNSCSPVASTDVEKLNQNHSSATPPKNGLTIPSASEEHAISQASITELPNFSKGMPSSSTPGSMDESPPHEQAQDSIHITSEPIIEVSSQKTTATEASSITEELRPVEHDSPKDMVILSTIPDSGYIPCNALEEGIPVSIETCEFGTSPIPHLDAVSQIIPLPTERTSATHADINTRRPQSLPYKSMEAPFVEGIHDLNSDGTHRCYDEMGYNIPRMETVDVGTSPNDLEKGRNTAQSSRLSEQFYEEEEEEDEEDYGHYPGDLSANLKDEKTPGTKKSARKSFLEVGVDPMSDRKSYGNVETEDICIQVSPRCIGDSLGGIPERNILGLGVYSSPDTAFTERADNTDSNKQASYACSVAAESARSSISRILSDHLKIVNVSSREEASEFMGTYMNLVESVLSDCSYIANFCLLSNYQDYRPLLPSFQDEGMIESCAERANRILQNITMFPDHKITQALSPVLMDSCHVSILRLCNEVESVPQDSSASDKLVMAIVNLIDLFTIASGKLDGRSLLLYCAVVIHCLALPKRCFHRNIKLYNGLSRLISGNALEQNMDILARLLVICLELSSHSLRRGDGGRLLLAMLRLNKILQSQITIQIKDGTVMSAVASAELRNSHFTYVSLLREYIRGNSCKSALESRLNDAIEHSNTLLYSLRDTIC